MEVEGSRPRPPPAVARLPRGGGLPLGEHLNRILASTSAASTAPVAAGGCSSTRSTTSSSPSQPSSKTTPRRARATSTPSITFPPSSRPSTSLPTSAIPAFIGKDSPATPDQTCPAARHCAPSPSASGRHRGAGARPSDPRRRLAGAGNTAGVGKARRRAFAADSRRLSALNGTRPLHSPPHQRR